MSPQRQSEDQDNWMTSTFQWFTSGFGPIEMCECECAGKTEDENPAAPRRGVQMHIDPSLTFRYTSVDAGRGRRAGDQGAGELTGLGRAEADGLGDRDLEAEISEVLGHLDPGSSDHRFLHLNPGSSATLSQHVDPSSAAPRYISPPARRAPGSTVSNPQGLNTAAAERLSPSVLQPRSLGSQPLSTGNHGAVSSNGARGSASQSLSPQAPRSNGFITPQKLCSLSSQRACSNSSVSPPHSSSSTRLPSSSAPQSLSSTVPSREPAAPKPLNHLDLSSVLDPLAPSIPEAPRPPPRSEKVRVEGSARFDRGEMLGAEDQGIQGPTPHINAPLSPSAPQPLNASAHQSNSLSVSKPPTSNKPVSLNPSAPQPVSPSAPLRSRLQKSQHHNPEPQDPKLLLKMLKPVTPNPKSKPQNPTPITLNLKPVTLNTEDHKPLSSTGPGKVLPTPSEPIELSGRPKRRTSEEFAPADFAKLVDLKNLTPRSPNLTARNQTPKPESSSPHPKAIDSEPQPLSPSFPKSVTNTLSTFAESAPGLKAPQPLGPLAPKSSAPLNSGTSSTLGTTGTAVTISPRRLGREPVKSQNPVEVSDSPRRRTSEDFNVSEFEGMMLSAKSTPAKSNPRPDSTDSGSLSSPPSSNRSPREGLDLTRASLENFQKDANKETSNPPLKPITISVEHPHLHADDNHTITEEEVFHRMPRKPMECMPSDLHE